MIFTTESAVLHRASRGRELHRRAFTGTSLAVAQGTQQGRGEELVPAATWREPAAGSVEMMCLNMFLFSSMSLGLSPKPPSPTELSVGRRFDRVHL